MADTLSSDLKVLRNTKLSNDVRLPAKERLAANKDVGAVPGLIETLKDDDWWSSCMAADLLAGIGDPRAVEPLLAMVHSTRPVSGSWSSSDESYITALGKLGDPGFDALVSILRERKDIRRFKALDVLHDDFGARAYDQAVEALDDPDSRVRDYACRVLGWIGDKRATPKLVSALPDRTVAAAVALRDLNDPDALASLQAFLDSSAEKSQEEVKYLREAIGKLKGS
jgi:HEAT repeat protein